MKYISADIETTGLDSNKHQIIECAFVIDDLSNPQPIESLHKFTTYVSHLNDLTWSMEALCMFQDRILEYKKAEKINANDIVYKILEFCAKKVPLNVSTASRENITFAGKNFASFDKGFLSKLQNSEHLLKIMNYRFLDPGSMYVEVTDFEIPSTKECKKRAGLGDKVQHRALDDALDVVRLIRKKYNIDI